MNEGTATNIIGGQASNIYFGTYEQSSAGEGAYNIDPIKWRVLANNADTKQLFLLSDQALDTVKYHTESEAVTWATSTIRSWLNGLAENKGKGDNAIDYKDDNFLKNAFSAKEQTAIVETKVINKVNPTYKTAGGEDTNDKIFLLSIDEANNKDYFTDSATRMCVPTDYAIARGAYKDDSYKVDGKTTCWWWLRSSGLHSYNAADVYCDGGVSYIGGYVNNDYGCVRPAFNLNLESVIFTSAAVGGKKSATGTISKIADYSGNDWKVTLKDSSRKFDITDKSAKSGKPGDKITLSYTEATIYNKDSTPNEYISVIITDSNGNAIYYGRVTQPTSASGNVSITIPTDLADGEYTLNVFSEQYNGGANDDTKLTDYASEFSAIKLTVEPYQISVNFDENSGDWAEGYTPTTSYMSNETLTLPTKNDISRTGYTFDGWELLETSSRTVKNYIAKWKINQYTLTFVLDNGEDNKIIKQDYNTNVTAPAPTRVGYTFEDWDKTVPSKMPAESVTYTAKWTVNSYTITFDTDGGTVVDSITQDYDTEITTKPQNPTKVGYTFDGWNTPIPDKMPLNGMTIKAKWTVNQYTLTFVLDNCENVTIKQNYKTNVTAPIPARVGYIFEGWDKVVPSTMPAESITYTAKWSTCSHADSTNKATCEKSAVCSECGATLPAAGHSFDANGKCTKTECGYVCDHTGNKNKASCTEPCLCSVCTKELSPATGHTFSEWKTTKSATFFKDGSKVYHCTHDGCTETRTEITLSTINRILAWFRNIFSFKF